MAVAATELKIPDAVKGLMLNTSCGMSTGSLKILRKSSEIVSALDQVSAMFSHISSSYDRDIMANNNQAKILLYTYLAQHNIPVIVTVLAEMRLSLDIIGCRFSPDAKGELKDALIENNQSRLPSDLKGLRANKMYFAVIQELSKMTSEHTIISDAISIQQ